MADIIFFGGNIYTMNDGQPIAEAIAVKDGIICRVGNLSDVMTTVGDNTELIYLNNATMLPGLIEAHQHAILRVLNNAMYVDVSPVHYDEETGIISYLKSDAILKIIDDTINRIAGKEWAIFFGWDPELAQDLPTLNADYIEERFSKEIPIMITAQNGHIAWVNNIIFEIAEINAGDQIEGGEFVTVDGKLTGMVREQPALMVILKKAPSPSMGRVILATIDIWTDYANKGFTTVTELALSLPDSREHYNFIREYILDSSSEKKFSMKEWPIRLAAYIAVNFDKYATQQIPTLKLEKLWIAGVKIWADGSPHGATIAVKEPFLNSWLDETLSFPPSPNCGILNFDNDELTEVITHFHKEGHQVAVHAQGERAIEQILGIYENIFPANNVQDGYPCRHRLEHFVLPTEEQIIKCAKLGVMTSFFVFQLYFYGESFSNYIFGKDRTDRWAPLATALKHGCKISIHQDSPTFPGPPLPFFNIMSAVTRECSINKTVYGAEQRISVHEALKAFTIGPAFQLSRENDLGSLEVGKKADFVIISKDPYKIPAADIATIKVIGTYLGGIPHLKQDHFCQMKKFNYVLY